MIKHIISDSPLISVIHNNTSPWFNQSTFSAGQVRYNPGSFNMEVYDGANWLPISNSVNLHVDSRLEAVFNWATEKMRAEQDIKRKAAQFPSIADALRELELAKEKLDVLSILCEEEDVQKTA